jgi:hypothetical protein
MAGDYETTTVMINGTPIGASVPLGTKSTYYSVRADRASGNKSSIVLTGTSGESAEVEIGLKPGSAATLFPRPVGESPGAVVVADRNPTPVAGHALVRFVHLSERQQDLQIKLGGRSITSLRLRSTAFEAFVPGRFDVRVQAAGRTSAPGTEQNVLSEFALDVTDGMKYTVVLSDAQASTSASDSTQLVVALIADRSFPSAAIADRSHTRSATGHAGGTRPAPSIPVSTVDPLRPAELAFTLDRLNGSTKPFGLAQVLLRLLFAGGVVIVVADLVRKLRGPRMLSESN